MTQYSSDLNTISPKLEDANHATFVNRLGWPVSDRIQPYKIIDQDHFQTLLAEVKREALNHDINPLIGAAAFLFVEIFQLEQARFRVHLNTLQETLENKVTCFIHYAKEAGYPSHLVVAAHYLLCAWIDEYLELSPLGKEKAWTQTGLLHLFQFDATHDYFFLILKRCLEHAQSHIDMLELIYLCLNLGFKGPYRHQPNGQKDLAIIIDHLYHQIRSTRGTFSKQLSVGEPGESRRFIRRPTSKRYLFLFPSLTTFIAGASLAVMNYQLGEKLSPLFNQLSRLVA